MNLPALSKSVQPYAPLLDEIKDEIANEFANRVVGLLPGVVEKIGEILISCKDEQRATNLREIQRAAVEKLPAFRFLLRDDIIKRFSEKLNPNSGGVLDKTTIFSLSSLTLVDDCQMQEELAVGDLAKVLRESCEYDFLLLTQAITQLIGRSSLGENENPCFPRLFCRATLQAIEDSGFESASRLEFFQILRPIILEVLPQVYRHCNEVLAAKGIQAEVKSIYGRPVTSTNAGVAKESAQASKFAAPAIAPNEQSQNEDAAGVAGILRRVLSGQAGLGLPRSSMPSSNLDGLAQLLGQIGAVQAAGQAVDASSASEGTPTQRVSINSDTMEMLLGLETKALFDEAAITHIQQNPSDAGTDPSAWRSNEISRPSNFVKAAKEKLSTPLSPVDGVVTDIVALMFDRLFEDARLPDSMKALVARLQFPVLKAALIDRTFFAETQHPLRQLINGMADFGIAYPEIAAHGTPIWLSMYSIVRELIESYGSDELAVSNAINKLGDLRNQAASETEKKDEEFKSLAEAESRAIAQHASTLELNSRFVTNALGVPFQKLIEGIWRPLLQSNFHESDGSNEQWAADLAVLDKLLWSVSPIAVSESRSKFLSELRPLLAQVNDCIERSGVEFTTREIFLQELHTLHTKLVRAPAANPVRAESADTEPLLSKAVDQAPEQARGGLLPTDSQVLPAARHPAPQGKDPAGLAETLGRGTWLNIQKDPNKMRQCRINWVSPRGSTYVLKDYEHDESFTIAQEELHTMLRRKTAVVIGMIDVVCKSIESAIVDVAASPA